MASSDNDDSIWGAVSADSGMACVDADDAIGGNDDDERSSSKNEDVFLFARVHRTVADRASTVQQLKAVIEACAKGSDERRTKACNHAVGVRVRAPYTRRFVETDESPLACAHKLHRGDMVALLLLSGARPRPAFGSMFNAVGAAAAYGQAETVRTLLRKWPEQANERLGASTSSSGFRGGTALHAALSGPRLSFGGYSTSSAQYVDCAEVLVAEGADANAVDADGKTPLFLIQNFPYEDVVVRRVLDLLVRRGGVDLNARDAQGLTLLHTFTKARNVSRVRLLLDEYGASADVVARDGTTPLLEACAGRSLGYFHHTYGYNAPLLKDLVEMLLRHSSPETRRAVRRPGDGKSAADLLLDRVRTPPGTYFGSAVPTTVTVEGLAWQRQAIAELLASGAPVLPGNTQLAQEASVEAAAAAAPATAATAAAASAPAAEPVAADAYPVAADADPGAADADLVAADTDPVAADADADFVAEPLFHDADPVADADPAATPATLATS